MAQDNGFGIVMTKIRYFIEAVLLYGVFYGFKIMPVETASRFGGWIGRSIGPRTGKSRKALKHLKAALPDLSSEEHQRILIGMWDNLGRVIAEYPHIRNISKNRTTIEGAELLAPYMGNDKGVMFAGAHLGNWEIGCAAPFLQLGLEVDSAYRAPNNPWAEHILLNARTLNKRLRAYTKSRTGGRSLLKAAKEKRNIVILFDQKYNEGMNVPFFGHDAMTNPAFVQIPQKYGLDLLPARIIREDNARFRLIVHPAIPLHLDDGSPRDDMDVMREAQDMLEGWIKEHPEQWLWTHKRWKNIK